MIPKKQSETIFNLSFMVIESSTGLMDRAARQALTDEYLDKEISAIEGYLQEIKSARCCDRTAGKEIRTVDSITERVEKWKEKFTKKLFRQ